MLKLQKSPGGECPQTPLPCCVPVGHTYTSVPYILESLSLHPLATFSVCSPGEGTPNCTNHPATNALATVSAVISVIRNASGQCVKLSTHVSKYVKPFEGGKDPHNIQMDMIAKVENGVTGCPLHI